MTTGRNDNWSQDRVDELEELYVVQGLSAGKIAAEMNMTRNAVIGKIFRLNLPRRKSSVFQESNPFKWSPEETERLKALWFDPEGYERIEIAQKLDRSVESVSKKIRQLDLPKRAKSPKVRILAAQPISELCPIPEVDVEPLHLGLMDLTDSTCKFECSGEDDPRQFSFCGHPTAKDRPYCVSHCKISFQPPPPPRNRNAPVIQLGKARGGIFGRAA